MSARLTGEDRRISSHTFFWLQLVSGSPALQDEIARREIVHSDQLDLEVAPEVAVDVAVDHGPVVGGSDTAS